MLRHVGRLGFRICGVWRTLQARLVLLDVYSALVEHERTKAVPLESPEESTWEELQASFLRLWLRCGAGFDSRLGQRIDSDRDRLRVIWSGRSPAKLLFRTFWRGLPKKWLLRGQSRSHSRLSGFLALSCLICRMRLLDFCVVIKGDADLLRGVLRPNLGIVGLLACCAFIRHLRNKIGHAGP